MGHGLACLPGCGWAVLAILTYMCTLRWMCALVHRPGLLVRLWLGSARHPHVLRVRSGGCALCAVRPQSACAADGLQNECGMRRQRPLKMVRDVPPSVFEFGEVKTRSGRFHCPTALQIM